jgi:hypothetical protein
MQVYAKKCRPVKSRQISAGVWRYLQAYAGQAKAVRYLQVYGGICRHMRVRQKPSDICRYMEESAGICGSGKSRQITAVRSGSLLVDLYLPRLWAACRIKDFIWPDCESEVRSAAGRAASEHWSSLRGLIRNLSDWR